MSEFSARLNQSLVRMTSDDVLSGRGLGNEIGFWIFDYPAEEELKVREFLSRALTKIGHLKPGLKVAHVDLFDLVINHLAERGLLERAIELQRKQGDEALAKALKPPLDGTKLADVFIEKAVPEDHDLVVVSGVGRVWPLIRSHNLLNNLHERMGETPLVMFVPGEYDGKSIRLFGEIGGDNYYRAFKLA